VEDSWALNAPSHLPEGLGFGLHGSGHGLFKGVLGDGPAVDDEVLAAGRQPNVLVLLEALEVDPDLVVEALRELSLKPNLLVAVRRAKRGG